MAMDPTVFVFSLMVIANIKSSSQNEDTAAPRANSLEKYSELMDQLFGETEGDAPTPAEDRTTIQNTEKGSEREPTTGQKTWLEFSTETVANTVRVPINTTTSTEYDVTSNETKIVYLNNVPSSNSTLAYVEDGNINSRNMNQFNSSNIGFDGKLDGHEILQYLTDNSNLKPNLHDHLNVYNTAGPRYLNSTSVEKSKALPWYNSRERFDAHENNDDLPNMFNSRRSLSNNNTLVSLNQVDGNQGLGVVLKEEIVFEIEDDKPPALSSPPIKTRLPTTTPKPTVELFKPKIKDKDMNTKYIQFPPSTVLNQQRVLVNKSMYEQMKEHKMNYFNFSNHQKLLIPKRMPQMTNSFDNNIKNIRPLEITRQPENNVKLQTEFKKLNEKLNTLQEFLNKTLERENGTKTHQSHHLRKVHNDSDNDKHQSTIASLLRTGHTNMNEPVLHRTVVKRIVNNGAPPLISNANQRIMENILPGRNIITQPALMRQVPIIEPRLQRRLMLLELANIAKLKHDINLISRMRKRPKYGLPVYRRRVILKPLGRIL